MFKQVFKDANGRACLRIDQSSISNGPTTYIMLDDGIVGIHTLPYQDFHRRFSADIKNYDVGRAAKLLLQPLSKEVRVTEKAKKVLDAIVKHPKPIYPEPQPYRVTKMNDSVEENKMETTKGRNKKVATKVKTKAKSSAAKQPVKKATVKAAPKKTNGAVNGHRGPGGPTGPRGTGGRPLETKIKVLTKQNPRREGTAIYDRFELYSSCKTVGDYLRAGGTTADLRRDQASDYITLD